MTKNVDGLPVFKVGESDDDGYSLLHEHPPADINGVEYEAVTQVLCSDDFYQGRDMMSVIRRKSDGKLFGYQWWEGDGKYGEAEYDSNGDEFGLEGGFNDEGDYYSFYVFQPVKEWIYVGYQYAN
jgi:hypothetical protein